MSTRTAPFNSRINCGPIPNGKLSGAKADWQPIETAPRDGTEVYLRSKHFTSDFKMRWSAIGQRWETKPMPSAGDRIIFWACAEEPTEWRNSIPL
jgi:hypothetical protein